MKRPNRIVITSVVASGLVATAVPIAITAQAAAEVAATPKQQPVSALLDHTAQLQLDLKRTQAQTTKLQSASTKTAQTIKQIQLTRAAQLKVIQAAAQADATAAAQQLVSTVPSTNYTAPQPTYTPPKVAAKKKTPAAHTSTGASGSSSSSKGKEDDDEKEGHDD